MEELVKYLRALVLFEIQTRTDPDEADKPEMVLHRAGFSNKEIGDLLNKNPASIAKAISRDKAARKRTVAIPT